MDRNQKEKILKEKNSQVIKPATKQFQEVIETSERETYRTKQTESEI